MKCLIHAIRQHQAELAAFLRARTDAGTASDLLQDVFLRALTQGHGFCDLQNPRAWLFRVARNALIDHQRRQGKTQPLSEAEPQDSPPQEPDTVDLLTECLGRNLARLSPADREIIEFCDLADQTVKAYAERHAISLPAAKSRLLRARQRLRRSLEAHCALRFDEQGRVCDFTAPDQTRPAPHKLP